MDRWHKLRRVLSGLHGAERERKKLYYLTRPAQLDEELGRQLATGTKVGSEAGKVSGKPRGQQCGRPCRILVRFTEEEYRQLQMLSDQKNTTMARCIREALGCS